MPEHHRRAAAKERGEAELARDQPGVREDVPASDRALNCGCLGESGVAHGVHLAFRRRSPRGRDSTRNESFPEETVDGVLRTALTEHLLLVPYWYPRRRRPLKPEMDRQKRGHRFRRCVNDGLLSTSLSRHGSAGSAQRESRGGDAWPWTSVGSTAAPLATDADQISASPRMSDSPPA